MKDSDSAGFYVQLKKQVCRDIQAQRVGAMSAWGIAPGRKQKQGFEPQRGGTNTILRLGSPRWGFVNIVLNETWGVAPG